MKQFPINIFLPAAGLGERLRPITNHLPKPLLPILGKPLIEIILERIAAACSGNIGINLHYKPELLRGWARASRYADRIRFFPEDPILGTGGALKNAEEFLSGGHFLVHNADILLDIDFERLVAAHLTSGNIATLVTHNHPKFSNVVVDENGLLVNVENPGDSRPDPGTIAKKVAYTGIAVYSPEILKFLPIGVSHMTVAWIAAAKAGHRVQTHDVTGAYWNDIGTPASYVASVLDALRENGETVFVSPAAACGKIDIDGYIVMESRSEVRDDARLRNCLVMPDARVSGRHENRIIGPDYAVELKEAEVQPSVHAREQEKGCAERSPVCSVFRDSNRSRRYGLCSELRTPGSERPIPGGCDPDRPRRVGQALLPCAQQRENSGAHGVQARRPGLRAPSHLYPLLRGPCRAGAGPPLVR